LPVWAIRHQCLTVHFRRAEHNCPFWTFKATYSSLRLGPVSQIHSAICFPISLSSFSSGVSTWSRPGWRHDPTYKKTAKFSKKLLVFDPVSVSCYSPSCEPEILVSATLVTENCFLPHRFPVSAVPSTIYFFKLFHHW
jgi:hypothetical protein